MVELAVVAADITATPCDLLLLKHADGFYGVDLIISERLGFTKGVPEGEATLLTGRNIEARQVLYIGVGNLAKFRYPQIRRFGRWALELAASTSGRTRVLCTPLHGPGYGLDEREVDFWMGLKVAHTQRPRAHRDCGDELKESGTTEKNTIQIHSFVFDVRRQAGSASRRASL